MQSNVVDYGNTSSEFAFQFPSGMKRGETVRQHLSADKFLDHVGITNADIFNPTSARITTASGGQYGVSVFHDAADGDSWMKTANRVPLIAPNVDATHQHISIPGHLHSNELRIRPTADQFKARAVANTRKALGTWATMTSANVAAGVHKSTLGDKTRYIITKGSTAEDGTHTAGAMHAYITRNANNPKFMKGMFTPSKVHMSHVNGEPGYVVDEPTYKTMKNMLGGVVQTHSPFGKGFGVAVTKLDDKADDGVHVNVNFSRTPLSGGKFMPVDEAALGVMEHHLRGDVSGATGAAAPASTALPGWEDVKPTDEMMASHVVEAVDGADEE